MSAPDLASAIGDADRKLAALALGARRLRRELMRGRAIRAGGHAARLANACERSEGAVAELRALATRAAEWSLCPAMPGGAP